MNQNTDKATAISLLIDAAHSRYDLNSDRINEASNEYAALCRVVDEAKMLPDCHGILTRLNKALQSLADLRKE